MEKYRRAGQTADDSIAHAHCMLDNSGYKRTLRVFNTCCFSTATVVARTRLSVTLHLRCLSCCTFVRYVRTQCVASSRPVSVSDFTLSLCGFIICCHLVQIYKEIFAKPLCLNSLSTENYRNESCIFIRDRLRYLFETHLLRGAILSLA